MWCVQDVWRLKRAGKTNQAIESICLQFDISVQQAADILRDLDKHQWHHLRIPGMDERVKAVLAAKNAVEAVKLLRAETNWGLMECKLYMEDLGRKKWPEPHGQARGLDEVTK